MHIDAATPNDAQAIATVHVSSVKSTYRGLVSDDYLGQFTVEDRTVKWREVLVQPDQFTLVAKVGDRGIVGFANGGPQRADRDDFDGELYAIYILEEFQGQGIGRQLFRRAIAELAAKKCHRMMVWALEANPYCRFYESLGGVLVDRKPKLVGEREMHQVAYGWHELAVGSQQSAFGKKLSQS